MKTTFQLLALAILLAGCSSVPNDAQVRAKLIGDWITLKTDNLEWTINSDGSYVSTFTRGGLDYEYEGTWTVKDRVLILKLIANHSVNTKHTLHAGIFDTYKIVYVDSVMLVTESPSGIFCTFTQKHDVPPGTKIDCTVQFVFGW